MIHPTLFVGLGTTGLKILKSLRQLMFEEYGPDGLPIFHYVSIETDGGIDAADKGLTDGIKIVKATIPNTAPIKDKLDDANKNPALNKHLKEWLEPELLEYVAAFMAGASNIRMAGRLCLWENWGAVTGALRLGQAAISAPATTADAVERLTKHYVAKGLPIPAVGPIDVTATNVYIVGSLCGGSCSGMLIDVAYFCQNFLGAGAAKNVRGIFTMYDESQAVDKDDAIAVKAANCYAALSELNYYSDQRTTYDITFPSRQPVQTTKPPFDYVGFVSRSNKTGGIFAKPDASFDEDGLNFMVALNLFADTAGDTDGKKNAVLADGIGFPGIGGLKAVPKGQIPMMVKAMASFGLTAVWYPKYRIATAAACLVSQSLCKNWLGTHVDQAVIVQETKKEWKTILDENIEVLAAPKGQPALKDRIRSALAKAESKFKSVTSANQLKDRMTIFPQDEGGSFRDKFAPGGEYYTLMEMQVSVCKKAFLYRIERTLNTQLGRIDFESTYGLGDVRMLFEVLDKEIEQTINKLPVNSPTLDLNRLNFDLMQGAENNRWTKFIFLHDQSVEEQQKTLIDNYQDLIIGDQKSIYQSVRNNFLRSVLQEVRAHLGFGVPTADADELTVKQELNRIEMNLKNCIQKFNEDYEAAIEQSNSTAVKIVTNTPQNRIDEDAKALETALLKIAAPAALLNGGSMTTFLAKTHSAITAQMTETYRRLSLEQIPIKNVVEQVRKILEAGGAESLKIKDLANRSDAYQNFIAGYEPFAFAPPLKIISGHDPTPGHNGLNALQKHFVAPGGVSKFPRIGSSSVDHLLFFYQAESGFALDDLASYKMLKRQFERKPGKYGHSTHKDPNFYDLALYHKTRKLQRWCRALGKLVPNICDDIDENAFSDVFYPTGSGYVFEYKVDGLSERLGLYKDQDGIKRLSQKQNETAYESFFDSVRSRFKRLDRKQIEDLIDESLREIENNNDHASLSKFYRQFLDEIYLDSDSTDDTSPDEEAALDSYFS